MTTYREPSRPLRLALVAPWCLLLGLVAGGAAGRHQLLLDPSTHQPAEAVSLSGPNWTGTLDAARLPADPTAGHDIAPASVSAAGSVQAATGFATSTGLFAADDTGVYVGGQPVADSSGSLYASNFVSAPIAYAQIFCFSDGSTLFVADDQLVWRDRFGNSHVLTSAH